jgi:putative ABC transport system permease protein
MNLVTIAWKSIRQRALASSLTALSVALGVMLMVSVLVVHGIVDRVFTQSTGGYGLVVGAKGSPLQLVLNTLYHVGDPVENIPYLYYKRLKNDPLTEHAIPICMGDVTQKGDFRIIGTTSEFFELPYHPDREFRVRGHLLEDDFDAVIGSQVARENGWDIGSQFQPVHGATDGHVHDEKFTIVGVLAATGTPNDKAVFININGFYQIAGHEKPAEEAQRKAKAYNEFEKKQAAVGEGAITDSKQEKAAEKQFPEKPVEKAAAKPDEHAGHDHHGHHHHELPDEQKEVTAVLMNFEYDSLQIQMTAKINSEPYAQAAIPAKEIYWILNNVVGNIRWLLVVMTALILIVSGVGIFVSIYNSMADRRREIAVMRALGAQRTTVFWIILCESLLLCTCGALFGMLLGHGLVVVAAPLLEAKTGLLINPWAFEKWELVLLPAMVCLASAIGIIPGMTAYRTDVAKALQS